MSSNKPWLEGPSPKDRAIAKMWQGGPLFLIGVISTAGTAYFLGLVWIWTVLVGIAGLFWFLTGLITYWTGAE
ncbi:hypothetical protein [Allorhodopirellula solitaria]|uniref:Uncharacterized protein n=1 Tax=Allorhodopirellula solitaria TaxID=2527987 RepID=A0A5C5XUE6_9BACT|nr:hypothetical protein [Allorhodopirellula solitaria]TWT66181.1 hypothetical protein CA85_30450 [Allorhodopirellula solitaria]